MNFTFMHDYAAEGKQTRKSNGKNCSLAERNGKQIIQSVITLLLCHKEIVCCVKVEQLSCNMQLSSSSFRRNCQDPRAF